MTDFLQKLYEDSYIDDFLAKQNLERRKKISNDICIKLPDCVPIIICCAKGERLKLKQQKFLARRENKFINFIQQVRHMNPKSLDQHTSLFFFTFNGILIKNTLNIEDIYYQYKNTDGFLYLIYTIQESFG